MHVRNGQLCHIRRKATRKQSALFLRSRFVVYPSNFSSRWQIDLAGLVWDQHLNTALEYDDGEAKHKVHLQLAVLVGPDVWQKYSIGANVLPPATRRSLFGLLPACWCFVLRSSRLAVGGTVSIQATVGRAVALSRGREQALTLFFVCGRRASL